MNQLPANFAFVLVNYKTPLLTPIALELLRPYAEQAGAEIWVVDNYSNDESTQYLRSLDWIRLIERPHVAETGALAHGRALDMVMEKISVDYLYLLHTDTFVYKPVIFDLLMRKLQHAGDKAVAIGCLDQIYRGAFRTNWRKATRFLKHHGRTLKLKLGLKSRPPKPYKEIYLKSFCALWNIRLVKQMGMKFADNDQTPGYAIQDRLTPQGYRFETIPERLMFRHLDHIEAGTISAIGGYGENHRRLKKYEAILAKTRRTETPATPATS